MRLEKQLENLRKKRRDEVLALYKTYRRTKRDVTRAASPTRLIRRHMGASLGIAALMGVLLAWRLGKRGKNREQIMDGKARSEESSESAGGFLKPLLREVAVGVLSRVNVGRMVGELVQAMRERKGEAEPKVGEGSGREVTMAHEGNGAP